MEHTLNFIKQYVKRWFSLLFPAIPSPPLPEKSLLLPCSTVYFLIFEPRNPPIYEFFEVQKLWSVDFESIKLQNNRSGSSFSPST